MLKNSIWALIEQLAYPVFAFLSVKVVISSVGASLYGVWVFWCAMIGISGVGTVALSMPIIKVIAETCSNDNELNESDCNQIIKLSVVFGVLLGCLGFVCVSHFGITELDVGTTSDAASTRKYLIPCAIASIIFLDQIDGAISSINKGLGSYIINANIEIFYRFIQTIFIILAAYFLKSIEIMLLAFLTTLLIKLSVKYYVVQKKVSNNSDKIPNLILNLVSNVKWNFLHGTSGFIYGSADKILAAAMLGVDMLSGFSLVLMLPQQIYVALSTIFSVTVNGLAKKIMLYKNGLIDWVGVRKYIINGMLIMTALNCVVFAIAYNFFQDLFVGFLNADVAPEILHSSQFFYLAYLGLSLLSFPHFVAISLGKFKFLSLLNSLASVMSILSMIYFINLTEYNAWAFSKLVFFGVLSAQIIVLAKSYQNKFASE